MDSNVRKLLFTPLSKGILSVLVPDFCIHLSNKKIKVPAHLTSDGEGFNFTLHFMKPQPPSGLGNLSKSFLTQTDQFTISGQIEGEIAFRCRDVFPPFGATTRSRGTSTIKLTSSRLELPAEATDRLNSRKLRDLLGIAPDGEDLKIQSFDAHVIFHGPKLRIRDSGTETKRVNAFLGEAASSAFDTHVFSGLDYEGALIAKENELHLHLRSKKGLIKAIRRPSELVDRVVLSVAFAFGFHPWPVYREIRINHRVTERWISPRMGLKQTFLAPISEALWVSYFHARDNPLYRIISVLADGLNLLEKQERSRIETLLWHVRSSDLSELPHSTKMLILCSAFDGLMQLIAGYADNAKRAPTNKVWKSASDVLQLSWEDWTNSIFELRKKHRDDLSHGRLWVNDQKDFASDFVEYARIGCAFMTVIAARCGYEGPILADPYEPRQIIISSKRIKQAKHGTRAD